jgi:hypothetical protein
MTNVAFVVFKHKAHQEAFARLLAEPVQSLAGQLSTRVSNCCCPGKSIRLGDNQLHIFEAGEP